MKAGSFADPVDVRQFRRAARKRSDEARFLFDHGFTTAAVYLAGYAVECSLKALILSSEPAARQRATLQTFRGAKAHEFQWLARELQRRAVTLPLAVHRQLAALNWWTTALRYSAREIGVNEAHTFLSHTREFVKWAEGRL